jgi:hypothetical protein
MVRSFLLCLASTLAITLCATGQITNVTGDQAPPIPGSGHGYIESLNETVNLSDGSLSIRVPVSVPPGRGHAVSFAFAYDSKGAQHFAPPGGYTADNSGYLSKAGWSYLVPQLSFLFNDDYWFAPGGSPPQRFDCIYYTDYMMTDAQGLLHALYISAAQPLSAYNCQGNGSPSPTGVVPQEYLQGGDWQVNASTTALGTGSNSGPTPVTVSDVYGKVYYFSNSNYHAYVNSSNVWASLPDWIEDSNGNKITFTDSGNGVFSITDTLGRTVLSSSGFGGDRQHNHYCCAHFALYAHVGHFHGELALHRTGNK